MSADPYQTLGLAPDADDAAVRARYLELVRRHPPEQAPERFAAVRAAYERVRDRDARLRYRLFEAGRGPTIDGLIEEAVCRTRRHRVPLAELLASHRGR
jgi:curved DNA-binding protein CbpA